MLNIKFINSIIILLSFINKIFYKIFNELILFIDLAILYKLINSFLNLKLLYYKLIKIIKL